MSISKVGRYSRNRHAVKQSSAPACKLFIEQGLKNCTMGGGGGGWRNTGRMGIWKAHKKSRHQRCTRLSIISCNVSGSFCRYLVIPSLKFIYVTLYIYFHGAEYAGVCNQRPPNPQQHQPYYRGSAKMR